MTAYTRNVPALIFLGTAILFGMLSGCSIAPPDDAANDAAAVEALNKWWKEFTYWPPPVKVGTVVPAHTITMSVPSLKDGKSYKKTLDVPRHIQTEKEADADAENTREAEHTRSLVQGFTVKGQTVTVLTNLTHSPADMADARELCANLGSFMWLNGKESGSRFGLQNIWIMGAHGELLSSRIGFAGKVQ